MKIWFTSHYNWEWVVMESLADITSAMNESNIDQQTTLEKCERFRNLPSSILSIEKVKPSYALFRLDLVDYQGHLGTNPKNETSTNPTHSETMPLKVRTRSDVFGFLDPKDSLVRMAKLLNVEHCLPDTLLLDWNCLGKWIAQPSEERNKALAEIRTMLAGGPKLLKAPLGSGGFGLYFVYSVHDIEEIVKCHKQKADESDGFMRSLSETFYGFDADCVLAWSLQEIHSTVRVASPLFVQQQRGQLQQDQVASTSISPSTGTGTTGGAQGCDDLRRRCQVRAYVALVGGALYLCSSYEVRLPAWDMDLDATLAQEYAAFAESESVPPSVSVSVSVSVLEGKGEGEGEEIRLDAGPSADADAEASQTSLRVPEPVPVPVLVPVPVPVPVSEQQGQQGQQWTSPIENEYVGGGRGRPYNERRNKARTERYVLSELPELADADVAVTRCMTEFFTALKPVVVQRMLQTGGTGAGAGAGADKRKQEKGQSSGVTSSLASPHGGGGVESHVFDAKALIASFQNTALAGTTNTTSAGAGVGTDPVASHSASGLSLREGAPHDVDVAIVGVDLVLDLDTAGRNASTTCHSSGYSRFVAKIVEINNNPAMPSNAQGDAAKHMSARYRAHLVRFVGGVCSLSMQHAIGGAAAGCGSNCGLDRLGSLAEGDTSRQQLFVIL
jgi:hypothetical protein